MVHYRVGTKGAICQREIKSRRRGAASLKGVDAVTDRVIKFIRAMTARNPTRKTVSVADPSKQGRTSQFQIADVVGPADANSTGKMMKPAIIPK